MKKLFAGVALAAVLISGVFFAANTNGEDLTYGGDRHPPIIKYPLNFESVY